MPDGDGLSFVDALQDNHRRRKGPEEVLRICRNPAARREPHRRVVIQEESNSDGRRRSDDVSVTLQAAALTSRPWEFGSILNGSFARHAGCRGESLPGSSGTTSWLIGLRRKEDRDRDRPVVDARDDCPGTTPRLPTCPRGRRRPVASR